MKVGSGLSNTYVSTSTIYYECTSTETDTVTSTTTPAQPTSTVTTTITSTSTAPTTTNTATSVVTLTSSVTTTTTNTVTATATATTTVSVASIIPAPAAYTPVQSSLPGSTYSGSGGADPIAKRGRPSIRDEEASNFKPGFSPQRYPDGIMCYTSQQSSTCTAATTSVTTMVTAATPAAATITATVIVTTATFPGANTTITQTLTTTATVSVTTFSTSTSTTTVTQTSTTTTVYAACATNNLADLAANGNGFTSTNGPANYDYALIAGVSSAFDCCNAAFAYSNQLVQMWVWNYSGYRQCEVNYATGNNAVCSQASTANAWGVNSASGATGETIGNGPCGEFNSVN